MISLKVLRAAAAIALLLPMVVPSESFAENHNWKAGGNVRAGVPGGGAVRMGGGNYRANVGAPAVRYGGGAQQFNRGGNRYAGGGGYYRRSGNGFIPGAAAGAVIGGALASQSYGYYTGPAYAPGYYDDQSQYDDDGGVVAVAPDAGGDDAVAYCVQTYRSYDPRSGTYLGNDGYRHPCP
jgi:hypothetical protein